MMVVPQKLHSFSWHLFFHLLLASLPYSRSQSIGALRLGPDTDTPVHKRWYLWTAVSIVGGFLIVACFFVWRGFRNYKRYKRALEEDERLEWEAKAAGRAGNGESGGQTASGQGVVTYYAEPAAERAAPAEPAGNAHPPVPADELGGYRFMQQYAAHHTFAALHAHRPLSASHPGAPLGHASSAPHQHVAVASASATVAAAKPHGLPARPASAAAVMSAPASPLASGTARAAASTSSMPLSAALGSGGGSSSKGVPIEQRVSDLDARYQSLVARVGPPPLYKGTAGWGQSDQSAQSPVNQHPATRPAGLYGSSSGKAAAPRPTPLSAGMTSWPSLPTEAKLGAAGAAQQGDSGAPVVIEMAPTTAARAEPDVYAGPAGLATAQPGKQGGTAAAANGARSNGDGLGAGVQNKAVKGLARARSFSSVEQLPGGGWQDDGSSTAELLKRLGLRRLPRPLGNTADGQGWTTRPKEVSVV